MWFSLSLHRLSTPLGCLVGKDKLLYWRLVDVATLMGISNSHGFASRYRNSILGKDVALTHFNMFTQNSKLISADQVLQLLQQRGFPELAERFIRISEGSLKVYREEPPAVRRKFHQKFTHLVACETNGNTMFLNWVSRFMQETAQNVPQEDFSVLTESQLTQPTETEPTETEPIEMEPMETKPPVMTQQETIIKEEPVAGGSCDNEEIYFIDYELHPCGKPKEYKCIPRDLTMRQGNVKLEYKYYKSSLLF